VTAISDLSEYGSWQKYDAVFAAALPFVAANDGAQLSGRAAIHLPTPRALKHDVPGIARARLGPCVRLTCVAAVETDITDRING
jgi:hypothetical protein